MTEKGLVFPHLSALLDVGLHALPHFEELSGRLKEEIFVQQAVVVRIGPRKDLLQQADFGRPVFVQYSSRHFSLLNSELVSTRLHDRQVPRLDLRQPPPLGQHRITG